MKLAYKRVDKTEETKEHFSPAKFLNSVGWIIVAGSALSLSAWSLYWVARFYGLPIPLAIITSTAFDGAAIVCGDLVLRYARTYGDSGLAPRLGMLILGGLSSWLNVQHAILTDSSLAARFLYGTPPLTALALLEMHNRWERRGALRRAGRIPMALPPFGRYVWLMHPIRVITTVRKITGYRIDSIEFREVPSVLQTVSDTQGTVSDTRGTVSDAHGTLPVDAPTIRNWARNTGLVIPERGPIAQTIVDSYVTALRSGNGKAGGS